MNIVIDIFIFYFGCIAGSFLNVVMLRSPEDHTLGGRSFCPHCKHTLSALELVPLFSFVFLRGRCRKCKSKISFRYPLMEILTGLLFLLGWLVLAPHQPLQWAEFALWLVMASACLVVFVVDLEHYIILDSVIFPALVLVLAIALASDLVASQSVFSFSGHLVQAIIGGLAGALPFFLLHYFSNGEWMGFGDVKLMLLLGAAVGDRLVLVDFLLAVFAGGLVSVFLLVFQGKNLKTRIPFGTFLACATLVTLLWGQALLHWYLGFLGL